MVFSYRKKKTLLVSLTGVAKYVWSMKTGIIIDSDSKVDGLS